MPEWARPARTPDACWLLAPEARGRELDTVEDLPVLLALSPPFAGLVRSDLKAEDGRPEPARLVPFCSDMLLALKLLAEQFHSFLMTVTGMSTDRCCMAQQEGAACRWWSMPMCGNALLSPPAGRTWMVTKILERQEIRKVRNATLLLQPNSNQRP